MKRDHKVRYRSSQTIRAAAHEWRSIGPNIQSASCCIVDYIENYLPKHLKGKQLSIKVRDLPDSEFPAYVTFEKKRPDGSQNVELHVDTEIWKYAKQGNEEYRYILAHEVGHIVLHDAYSQPYSFDESSRIKYAQEEERAEWQADLFADYFLINDEFINVFHSIDEMAQTCQVRISDARRRIEQSVRDKNFRQKVEGDSCSDCGNYTLRHNGTYLMCDTCSSTTGCS